MKVASLNIDGYLIECYNNMWTGVETVYVNGRQVSRQFNWFHGIHRFTLSSTDDFIQDDYRVNFRFSWTSMTMIDIDIARNGVPLMKKNNPLYVQEIPTVRRNTPPQERLELRQLERQPLYREEDLV